MEPFWFREVGQPFWFRETLQILHPVRGEDLFMSSLQRTFPRFYQMLCFWNTEGACVLS